MNGDDHGSHVSCGSGSGASPFLTGLVTCFATHDGIPARSTSTVIRLDAATECRCPGCLAPPPERFTAALLEKALRAAVAAVQMPCPPLEDGPERYARWGEQFDVRNITREGDDRAGELSAEQVAGYIAKYATAMIPAVVAVGSDPVRHRRDAWLWTCRPAVATVFVSRAVVARV